VRDCSQSQSASSQTPEDEIYAMLYVKRLLTLSAESAGRSGGTVVYELFEGKLGCRRRPSRGQGGLISGQRPARQVSTCTSTRSKESQPCIRAAFRSGWLLAVPHVVGEQHSEFRFVELPP
jgi:hypothetical protein